MRIHSNIPKLYLIKISKWFMLYMPIAVLFYESNHLSMSQIMFIQAIYSISIVILEIPSGYLADVWGRKNTLALGAVMGTLGFTVYGFSHGMVGFIIAEIILGIGQSCISGADSAMLYDSLLEKKQENLYSKLEGRISSYGNIAEAAAAIIGGILAISSLRHPYYGQTLIAALAIPAAFTLHEPLRHKKLIEAGIKDILGIAKFSLFINKELRNNILFSAFTGCATLTLAWFAQPIFEFHKIEVKWFGALWAGLNLIVAASSLIAYKIENKIGKRASIILISLTIPFCYIAISFAGILGALSILSFFYLIRGFATPVLKDYINRITGSEIRATVLSVRNFFIRILFSIISPIIGYVNDIYDLPTALIIAGVFFLILNSLAAIIFLTSSKR